MFLLLC